ncbi:MAG: HAD family hydrolase [Candidatus Omnitrophica bacterium]|nr:HAD family hydrolase [Candidatus Omnitrophota bacterium]
MKGYKLIIFDLDGTLVDAYPAITRSFNFTMRKLSAAPRAKQVIRRAVGWGDANLLRPFIKDKDLKKGVLIYRKHHKKALIEDSRLFSHAKKLLHYLKRKGYKLAVASNRPTRFSMILIRHLGLERYFDYVLCGDKLKQGKPHPEILIKIMRTFSLKPKDALYIGDMNIDAQAGRRAKVRTIIVTTGSSGKGEIKKEKPYRIISGITELFRIL